MENVTLQDSSFRGVPSACRARPVFWAKAGDSRQFVKILGSDNPDVEAAIYDMNDQHQMVGFGPVPIPTKGRKSFYMTLQPSLWTSATTDVVDIGSYRRPRAGYAATIDGTGHLVGGYLQGNGGDTHAIIWIVP